MNLKLSQLENEITIDMASVPIIAMKDTKLYTKVIKSIFAQCNDLESELSIFLSESDKSISFDNIELILNPLLIDFNSKKISTAIVNRFKTILMHDIDFANKIDKYLQAIIELVEDEMIDIDIPLTFDETWNASKLIKAIGLQVEEQDNTLDILPILNKYLDIAGEFKFAKLHIFVGLNVLLSEDEYDKFLEYSLQKQIPILLIEHSIDFPNKNTYKSTLYIDEEFDEFLIRPILKSID